MRGRAAAWLVPFSVLVTGAASAETPTHGVVDRAVVRFLSPETGGTAHPRFVQERTLALEARLEAMAENGGIGDGYQERDLRAAMEHDVAEQMLASLAEKLIADSPAEKRPALGEVPRVEAQLGPALFERLGGRAHVDEAARAEQIEGFEVEALVHRAALAAWYLDRAVTPILHPSDEQLREVYRTSAHPYRAQPYDQAREALARWFVVERVRVAESAFLQSARSRVRIIVTR